MKAKSSQIACWMASLGLLTLLTACGGGSSGGPASPPPVPALVITTESPLPGTLQNHPYTATLSAANGQGALQWGIAPISATTSFVDGLSIDPNTGVLSGTTIFGGTAGFLAHVTDSASPPRTASKTFLLTTYSPLQPPPPLAFTVGQYQDVGLLPFSRFGGVYPLIFTLTGGSLPPGLRLDGTAPVDFNGGGLRGSAIAAGTYQSTLTIQDSYSPPEVVTAQLTVTVLPPPFSVADSIPRQMILNRPFSGRVVARGGIPPYHFAMSAGSLPTGLNSVDPNSGQIQGTPTAAAAYNFTIDVTDSSPAVQLASLTSYVTVANPIGRNDTVATATPIENGMITASISPYIDPPDNAPLAADTDYYKVVSLSGSTVHVETLTKRLWDPLTPDPIDTVLELVDGNNTRLTTCRQPGVTTNTFNSACINDDIGGNPPTLDSALDFKVPGSPNIFTTFYVHVLDWRGMARPDMQYGLNVSGAVPALAVQPYSLSGAVRGLSYSQQLTAIHGVGALSWTRTAGNLPPGISLDPTGILVGTATSNGVYTFTVQVADASTPPQTATAQKSITVVDPLQITSPATWPDACLNQPYTFAVQTAGGLPPLLWNFDMGLGGIYLDPSNGVFSGTPSITGTFSGTVYVSDGTAYPVTQTITLTIKQCP